MQQMTMTRYYCSYVPVGTGNFGYMAVYDCTWKDIV